MTDTFVLADTYEQARTWWRDNAPAEDQPYFRFASDGRQLLGRISGVLLVLPTASRHPRYGELLSIARTHAFSIRWVS